MAARTRLFPQFLWSSLQALEKYLKCILLLNRIKATNLGHKIGAGLTLISSKAPFQLLLKQHSLDFIQHLDTYGRFRYLETPFHVKGLELVELDLTVWSIRRYCRVLNHEDALPNAGVRNLLESNLRAIAASDQPPYRPMRLHGGTLEKIIDDRKHPARAHLLWKNLYFGQRPRKTIRLQRWSHATNSPLALHPEMLDEVLQYVFVPKDVVSEYRK